VFEVIAMMVRGGSIRKRTSIRPEKKRECESKEGRVYYIGIDVEDELQ